MSKTYLGNSGVVVMPVVDDTTTPVDNVYDLESVVLRSVDNPEGNPALGSDDPYHWSYNSTTGYIEGTFTERAGEGYIYGGSATTALWLDDDFVADGFDFLHNMCRKQDCSCFSDFANQISNF